MAEHEGYKTIHVMKRFLTTLCLVFSAITIASAQDIIVLKNSQRIDAKIISVSSTEVSYKKADYVDGPTFILNASEIATILYANGDAQVFNTEPERTRSSGSQKKSGGLKFNPEPLGNHPLGISIAYTSKQLKEVEGRDVSKSPWVYFGDDEYKKTSASLRAGVYWAPEFRYGIGIQTGLYYELSTSSYESGDDDSYYLKISGSEHTLSVPLRLQYRYEIIPDLSVFLYTGPSFDISLSYTYVYKDSWRGNAWNEWKSNLYEEGDVSRFNVLWGVGAGVRWKRLQLMLGGDWGISNLSRDDSVKARLNKPFHISFTYLFL